MADDHSGQEPVEELREGSERYRIITELVSDFAYCLNVASDGHLEHAWSTDTLERLTGYTLAEATAMGWEQIVHQDDMPLVRRHLHTIVSGTSDVSEFKIITRNGELRWIRSIGRPVHDAAQGRVVRIYGAARNITDPRRTLEALQLSEERFRALGEATFEGIVISESGIMLDLNPQFARIFGWEPGELIGRNIGELIAPQDRDRFMTGLSEGYNVPSVFPAIRKNGDSIVVELLSRLFPYKNRIARVTTCLDITERKHAEEALRESEERYRSMVSAVTAYTYSVEMQAGKAIGTHHSRGCVPVTGYEPSDYETQPDLWYSMIHPDDREQAVRRVQEVLAGREVGPLEHRLIRRDGAVVWVRNTIVPHRDGQGRLLRYDGLVEDITERKQAEQEKEQVISQLQQALAKVKMLSGLIPICAACKKIRDDKGYWQQLEGYIRDHSEAEFSHGICPECQRKLYPELYDKNK